MLNFGGTMEGNIYINGLIGSHRDPATGKIIERGVELEDVISDVHKLKGCERINVHINSEGGYLYAGKPIAKYIGSLPNTHTIAGEKCASIATEIHLSVPVERRSKVSNGQYLIHCPMYSIQKGVALNSDQLSEMSDDILEDQKTMASMYSKATGLDKTAVELLMKQETSLTDAQCKDMGFVSEIVLAAPVKAVAFFQPKQTNNNTDMSEFKKSIDALTAGFKAFKTALEGKPKTLALKCTKTALDLTTTEGVDVIVVTEADMPAVGDAVTMPDGNPVDDGTYAFDKGQLVVEGGKIKEILPPVAAAPDAELTALKAELENIKAEREEEKTALATLTAEFEKISQMSSTYKPAPAKVAFKKQGNEPAPKKTIAEYRAEKAAKAAKK